MNWRKPDWIMVIILLAAAILRFYGLDNQSLWVDELHTMRESDPAISLRSMFDYLLCCDPSPPLFFLVERLLFTLFGHSPVVARAFSAACGVAGVWGMFLLGKEILDRNLGLFAAAITAVNYYAILYSQEARCYSLLFTLTIFSYLFYFRLVKVQSRPNLVWYASVTILLLYTHYYSLFIVSSQFFISAILWFGEGENRKKFITSFLVAGAILLVLYLPWVPFMMDMMKVKSFWIGYVADSFMLDYFHDYFGHSKLLIPVLTLLIIYYMWNLFHEHDISMANLKQRPLHLSFLILTAGVAFSYFVPYLRSVLVVPMLFNRYTIVAVPAILMMIAYAVLLINNQVVRLAFFVIVIGLSLIDVTSTKKFYSKLKPTKTQFREVTVFMTENSDKAYPVVEEKTGWQHDYYLKRLNYQGKLLTGKKEVLVDSILLGKSPEYRTDGFWIVGAHGGEPKLDPVVRARLDSAYNLKAEKDFYDAWAQLFMKK